MTQKISVGMVSLGCAKNQVDAEVILFQLKEAGYILSPDPAEANIICINTCGFIDSAKQEAIDAILEMAEYKKTAHCKGIIVTGCLAERYAKEIIRQLPEVDAVIGVSGYDRICEAVETVLKGEKIILADPDDKKIRSLAEKSPSLRYFYNIPGESLEYLNLGRVLTTPKSYAYLKVAEGCDNKCTYCAIPGIRGPFRSRAIDDLIKEARGFASLGVKEIIVVAQDTTRYGIDISGDGRSLLPELIEKLDEINEIERIRLLYLYPDEVTEGLLCAMKNSKKMAHYIDIPLQHISDDILERMNRRGSEELICNVIKKFREVMPDCIIRTSLITGFPGETEDDHLKMKEFLSSYKLDRVGIFTYSKEEGTAAAEMAGQIRKSEKERRYRELMLIQQKISLEKNQKRIGEEYDVIVDGVSEDGLFYTGRSYGEAPDSDGLIYFVAKDELEVGDIVKVKILVADEYDLTGEQV
jgi:ribosomal protein S12 methylthiotransferase